MFLQDYRGMSQHDRALMDGRLITYHFYVAGATLVLIGGIGVSRGDLFPWVAVVFGLASLLMGGGLHRFHLKMIRSPDRESYLATIAAILGRHRFPLLPSLLGALTVFGLFATGLYLFAG